MNATGRRAIKRSKDLVVPVFAGTAVFTQQPLDSLTLLCWIVSKVPARITEPLRRVNHRKIGPYLILMVE